MPWNAIILCIHYSGEACVDSYYFLKQHKGGSRLDTNVYILSDPDPSSSTRDL